MEKGTAWVFLMFLLVLSKVSQSNRVKKIPQNFLWMIPQVKESLVN